MVTISLCMIVKNEEKVLKRCLDSLKGLYDEIIIVDTGSTDKTKEIAREYTETVYEFPWINDFSAARNYAFSLATKEYIYSADADEVLDETNREAFMTLKKTLLPEVDIVQMKYGNQLQYGAVYNFDEEYRPKLFKRIRHFVWANPVHELVRVDPIVFDSDIVITHKPHESHADRDLGIFRESIRKGLKMNRHLHNMYSRELMLSGTDEDFILAKGYFLNAVTETDRTKDEFIESCAVLVHTALIEKDDVLLMKFSTKANATDGCSEVCFDLGRFYEMNNDLEEAVIWYYNAAYETAPILRADCAGERCLKRLAECYEKMGMSDEAAHYREEIDRLNKIKD